MAEVFITKCATFCMSSDGAELRAEAVTRIGVTVEDDGAISRVIGYTPDGSKYIYGRDLLRSELGENGWAKLMHELGVKS